MSLYNMMFGQNPEAQTVLAVVGLRTGDVGRFRDAWVERRADGSYRVAVYTRNGGNNREDYMPDFHGHPLYIEDRDDEFDSTYATIYFSLPESVDALRLIDQAVAGEVDSDAKWLELLEALKGAARPG